MPATVNQLIAAAEKQAAIAAKIERRRRALAPYDAARLMGGIAGGGQASIILIFAPYDAARLMGVIAALNVGKIGGAVVIDPLAETRAALDSVAAFRPMIAAGNDRIVGMLQEYKAQIIRPGLINSAGTGGDN